MTAVLEERVVEEKTLDLVSIPPFLVEIMGRINMTPTFASERGLLYSFNAGPEKPENIDRYQAAKSFEYEVLIKTESITFRSITRTTGRNRKSDKIYSGWKVDKAITFSFKTEKHGHRVLRIYENITRTKKYRGHFVNATARYAGSSDFEQGTVKETFDPAKVKPSYTFMTEAKPNDQATELLRWAIVNILKELDPNHPAFSAKNFLPIAAYPVFQLFPFSELDPEKIRATLPKKFSLHSVPDAKKFITLVMGADSVRKDMVKAVVNTTNINALFLAAQLKPLFPLDWLRDFVKSPDDRTIFDKKAIYNEQKVAGLVALLEPLTLPQRKRLLVEECDDSRQGLRRNLLVDDSIRMLSQLNPDQRNEYGNRIDYSSWLRLHDTLQEVGREIRSKEESSVRYMEFEWGAQSYMQKLHDTSFKVEEETYVLKAPRIRGDLETWGNTMHNCIGSYYRRVDQGETNVFGIYNAEGILVANVEISNGGSIHQYMEKYNSRASTAHVDALKAHIEATDKRIKEEEAKNKRIQEAMKNHRERYNNLDTLG